MYSHTRVLDSKRGEDHGTEAMASSKRQEQAVVTTRQSKDIHLEFSGYLDSDVDDLLNLISDTESISGDEEGGITSDVGCGSVWLAIIGDDVGLDPLPFTVTSGP